MSAETPEEMAAIMADVQWISDAAEVAHQMVFEAASERFQAPEMHRAAVTGALAQAYCDSLIEGLGDDPSLETVNDAVSHATQFVAAMVLSATTGIETPLDFEGATQ
jgi:hypothetical protein